MYTGETNREDAMKTVTVLTLATALSALPAAAQKAPAPTPAIAAALADPARPEADRARDSARHAAELLAFAGVRPGMKVGDFIMGGGYWTRLLADVVGPRGKVFAYQPAEFIKYMARYATDQDAAVKGRANVVPSREPLLQVSFPEPLDAIVTVQNYHDLHLKMAAPDAAGKIAKRLYDALKPGGVLLVVDHVATSDPGFALPDTLHRIDPAAAKREIEAAGFRFTGELPVLRNPADPHTANVFDPAIRGKTDQFVYRFEKPKG
jgi:predicted methyltransferase